MKKDKSFGLMFLDNLVCWATFLLILWLVAWGLWHAAVFVYPFFIQHWKIIIVVIVFFTFVLIGTINDYDDMKSAERVILRDAQEQEERRERMNRMLETEIRMRRVEEIRMMERQEMFLKNAERIKNLNLEKQLKEQEKPKKTNTEVTVTVKIEQDAN